MTPQLSVGFVVRGLIAVAAVTLVSLPHEALALPRDRIAARRLARILPPGSTLTVPAAPVPPRRPAVVRVPASPVTPRRLAVPTVPPQPAAVAVAAKTAAPAPQGAPKNATAAPQAAPATAAAKPTQPPAAASGVQQAGGAAPAAKGVTPTGVWTLDDAPAADGTKSVLVPEAKQPTPAEPVELLPTP